MMHIFVLLHLLCYRMKLLSFLIFMLDDQIEIWWKSLH